MSSLTAATDRLPFAVPFYAELAAAVDSELPTDELRRVGHKLLRQSAIIRAAKDYIADVEHAAHQQLYAWHEAEDAAYGEQVALIESAVQRCCATLLDDSSKSLNAAPPEAFAEELVELLLYGVRCLMLHQCNLEKLRIVETAASTASHMMASLGGEHTRVAIEFDEAVAQHVFQHSPPESLDEKAAAAGIQDRTVKRMCLEKAKDMFEVPLRIHRMSYRPYDADAPFPPKLRLSVANQQGRGVPKPADVITDVCTMCSNIIADYGRAAPRSHCLDCDNGHNALCVACHQLSTFSLGATQVLSLRPTVASGRLLVDAMQRVVMLYCPHAYHHHSGIVHHAMAYTHSLVTQRFARMQRVLETAFSEYFERPLFGVVIDTQQPPISDPLETPVRLAHLGDVYRRFPSSFAAPNRRVEEDEADGNDTFLTRLRRRERNLDLKALHDQVPTRHGCVSLPLKFPVEPYRSASSSIEAASLQYHYPRVLETVWLTFGEVGRVCSCLRTFMEAVAGDVGHRVAISMHDAPLWYTVEFAAVWARRCAIGVYPLWQPVDICNALELAAPHVTFLDAHTFMKLVSFLLAEPSDSVAARSSLRKSLGGERVVVLVANEEQQEACLQGWAVLTRSLSLPQQLPTLYAVLVAALEPSLNACDWEKFRSDRSTSADQQPEPDVEPAVSSDAAPDDYEQWAAAIKRDPGDEDVFAIGIFTSGTSGGKPKAVLTRARQWHEEVVSTGRFVGICENALSAYAPSWATDKQIVWRALVRGGRVSFHCKSRSIFESIARVRPTPVISMVPFVANQLPPLFETITQTEQRRLERLWLEQTGAAGSADGIPYAAQRLLRVRAAATAMYHIVAHVLGDWVYIMSLGGAAVRADVLEFLRRNTPCAVIENYGLTETGGVLRDSRPFPGSQVKLVDRPELGYTSADKPFPRGEFAVKSMDNSSLGDWICDEDTRTVIAKRYLDDGYFLTGDIGLKRPDGTYEVIDRVSAVRKLANGKFFSPERVEQVLMDAAAAILSRRSGGQLSNASGAAVAATGDSSLAATCERIKSCFVQDDDVDHATIRVLFLLHPATDTVAETLPKVVVKDLQRLVATAAKDRGLPRDEIPTVVLLEADGFDWTIGNGCLTASRKPSRTALKKRMAEALGRLPDPHGIADTRTEVDPERRHDDDGANIRSLHDAALFLGTFLVPNFDAAHTHDDVLNAMLPDLGCDSLVLSRVPRLLLAALTAMRGSVALAMRDGTQTNSYDRTASVCRVKDASELPPLLLTTPMLMTQSLLSLATHCCCVELDAEAEHTAPTQPLFSRQHSSSLTVAATGGMTHENSAVADGDRSVLLLEALQSGGPTGTDSDDPSSPKEDSEQHTEETLPQRVKRLEDRMLATIDDMVNGLRSAPPSCEVEGMNGSVTTTALTTTATRDDDDGAPQPFSANGCGTLLTGAAGFFGSSILFSMLMEHDADVFGTVVCLVRAESVAAARLRVWSALIRLLPKAAVPMSGSAFAPQLSGGNERPHHDREEQLRALFDARVVCVCGDISHRWLGCESQHSYQATYGLWNRPVHPPGVATAVDIRSIIHAAAVVKSWPAEAGLEALFAPNVEGTLHLLRLASELKATRRDARHVPFLYVSTISVMKAQGVVRRDADCHDILPLSQLADGGQLQYYDAYAATKYMAENAVRSWATKTGAPVRIVRAPLLTWHSQSGFGNEDDWMCRVLDAVLSCRLAPTSSIYTETTPFAPVDRASRILLDELRELHAVGDNSTIAPFAIVYPFEPEDRINLMSVFRVVAGEVERLHLLATRALVDPSVMAPLMSAIDASQWPLIRAAGPIETAPAYAWRCALETVTVTHPTRYHPLLEKGLLELQRSAGVRPIHPLPEDERRDDPALADMEDTATDTAWVASLRKYLWHWRFPAKPV